MKADAYGNLPALPQILSSRLARHIGQLGEWPDDGVRLTRAQVQQVASRMPFLRQISFCLSDVEWSAEDRLRLSLPFTLSQVGIRFYKKTSAATMNSVIDFFSQHESLAALKIQIDESLPSLVSFAPLQALPALETLTLEVCEDPTLSAKQVEELRALSQLTRLNWNFGEEPLLLLQMLQSPHQLQWTALPATGCYAITDAVASLLPSLRRLRTLCLDLLPPSHESLSSLDFLTQLPALTEVDIRGKRYRSSPTLASGLVAAGDEIETHCQCTQ